MAFSVVLRGQTARGMYPGAQGAMHAPEGVQAAFHMKQTGPPRKGRPGTPIARRMWPWPHMKDD